MFQRYTCLVGDGSQNVLSAVVFLQFYSREVLTIQKEVQELAFVLANARVAPMKALTVLRLELQAAVLPSRLRLKIQGTLRMLFDSNFLLTENTMATLQ